MTRALDTRGLGDEAGFTLIEVLVAMIISTIVILATLNTLDDFSSNAARQTKVTIANDEVRNAMDRVVSDLRQAAKIEVAGANDLVYAVAASATQNRRERICMDGSSRLWRSTQLVAVSAAVPGPACPTPSVGAFRLTSLGSANSVANPLFRYDSATPASVRSVGMTFALLSSTAPSAKTSTLRASTFVRSRGEAAAAVTGDNISTVCNTSTLVPTLTLSSSIGPLTVRYTDVNGVTLGTTTSGSGLALPASATTVIATVTSTLTGAVTQIVKALLC